MQVTLATTTRNNKRTYSWEEVKSHRGVYQPEGVENVRMVTVKDTTLYFGLVMNSMDEGRVALAKGRDHYRFIKAEKLTATFANEE